MNKSIARLPRWRIVGFTGHRHLAHESAVRDSVRNVLRRLARRDVRLAVVGSAAAGADTLVLEAAREFNIPALVVLPFERPAFRKGFTLDEWKRAEPLIDSATEVEIVSTSDNEEAGFLEAGIRTVDRADVVVAVWDGEPPRGPAGTGAIVAYARALGRPLIIIDPGSGAAADETAGHPDGHTVLVDEQPAVGDERQAVTAFFERADSRATKLSPAAQWLVLWIVVLHLLATAVAVASVSFHLPSWGSMGASVVKLALLLAAIWLAWRHRRTHHTAIRKRMEAELCRSVLALWPLVRDGAMLPRVNVPGFQTVQRDLALTWLVDRKGNLPLPDAQRTYLNRISEQQQYFTRQHGRAAKQYRRLQTIALSATFAAIGCIVLSFALSALHREGELYLGAKFLSIVLPLANAAALTTILALDLSRRVERYRKMAMEVAVVMTRVQHATTWPTLWRAARDGEELLLHEAAEWLAVARFAGGAH